MSAYKYARFGYFPQEGVKDGSAALSFNRVHPQLNAAYAQELRTHLIGKIITIDGGFRLDADRAQRLRYLAQAVSFKIVV